MAQELMHRIILFRIDGNHMEVFESDDIKAVKNMYQGLDHEWVTSTAEKRPFRMPEPQMHSFAPSLISEIKVESISKEEYLKKGNPYYKQMQKDGFNGVMNQNFNNGGY